MTTQSVPHDVKLIVKALRSLFFFSVFQIIVLVQSHSSQPCSFQQQLFSVKKH